MYVSLQLQALKSSMKRIHIIGSGPRSGTTLLTEVMATCFHIDHSCDHEAPIYEDQPDEGNCFLTKLPVDIESVALPLRFNKDLYVVCVVRDPRDSIASFHGSNSAAYFTSLRYWKFFVSKFGKVADHRNFIWFRYEDFVNDPDGIQHYLMTRIPFLEKRHDFSAYHLVAKPSSDSLNALKGVRPIAPVGVGAWKNHLSRVRQQVEIHGAISDEIIAFGYEKDREWEQMLAGVKSGTFRSAKPEFLSVIDRLRQKGSGARETVNIFLRRIGVTPGRFWKPTDFFYSFLKNIVKVAIRRVREVKG